jgi:hypothetical protein
MKVTCICQFRDAEDYFPLFHAHHEKLFDKIIYLDHNSEKDYQQLNVKNAEVYRIDIDTYVLDLYKYAVLKHEKIHTVFDFLFVLDVDEFLPFATRHHFEGFLKGYQYYGVGTLLWKNAFPKDFAPLSACPNIYKMRDYSRTKKIFYNLRKVKDFIPNHGNHNAKYPTFGQTYFQIRPKRKKEGAELIHIPITTATQVKQKLNKFSTTDFLQKINFDETKDFAEENIYTKVANYREAPVLPKTKDDFIASDIFENLSCEVGEISHKVGSLPIRNVSNASLSAHQLNEFRSKGFGKAELTSRILKISSSRIVSLRGD